MGNALGLDIGYSNVIGVFGSGDGQPESIIRPSQAAPLSVLPGCGFHDIRTLSPR